MFLFSFLLWDSSRGGVFCCQTCMDFDECKSLSSKIELLFFLRLIIHICVFREEWLLKWIRVVLLIQILKLQCPFYSFVQPKGLTWWWELIFAFLTLPWIKHLKRFIFQIVEQLWIGKFCMRALYSDMNNI